MTDRHYPAARLVAFALFLIGAFVSLLLLTDSASINTEWLSVLLFSGLASLALS